MKIALDTNAYSRLAGLKKELVEYVDRADEVIVSAIVYGELLAGFGLGSRAARNRGELETFMELAGVHIAAVTADVAERYADLYGHLRRAGTPIPTNDLWIAATAMEHGARLVTYDKHYAVVPGLPVVAP